MKLCIVDMCIYYHKHRLINICVPTQTKMGLSCVGTLRPLLTRLSGNLKIGLHEVLGSPLHQFAVIIWCIMHGLGTHAG